MDNGAACPASDAIPTTGAWCDGKTSRSQNRWAAQVAALTIRQRILVRQRVAHARHQHVVRERVLAQVLRRQRPAVRRKLLPQLPPPLAVHGLGRDRLVMGFNQTWSGWKPDSSVTHNGPQVNFNLAQIQGYEFDAFNRRAGPRLHRAAGGVQLPQNPDGLIPQATTSIYRFGLMTFDNDTLPYVGVVTPFTDGQTFNCTNVVAATPPTAGMWSYYKQWWNSTADATRRSPRGLQRERRRAIPASEVGARNPAAPPWEGRMIRFPTGVHLRRPRRTTPSHRGHRRHAPLRREPNRRPDRRREVLLLERPRGPQGKRHQHARRSCRPQYIILLSHAAPNLDLQTYARAARALARPCAYDYPEYIAAGLASGIYAPTHGVVNNKSAAASGPPVKTFVVGFALDTTLGDAGEHLHCNDILTQGDQRRRGTPYAQHAPGVLREPPEPPPRVTGNATYASCARCAHRPRGRDERAVLRRQLDRPVDRAPASCDHRRHATTRATPSSSRRRRTARRTVERPRRRSLVVQRLDERAVVGRRPATALRLQLKLGDAAAAGPGDRPEARATTSRTTYGARSPAPATSSPCSLDADHGTLSETGNVRPYVFDNSGTALATTPSTTARSASYSYSPATTPRRSTHVITPSRSVSPNPVSPARTPAESRRRDMTAPFGSRPTTRRARRSCSTDCLAPDPVGVDQPGYPYPTRYYNSGSRRRAAPSAASTTRRRPSRPRRARCCATTRTRRTSRTSRRDYITINSVEQAAPHR